MKSVSGAPIPDNTNRDVLLVNPHQFQTIQHAVDDAPDGALILVSPGTYVETVTVPFAKSNLSIVADGPKFSVKIAPTTAGAKALVNDSWNLYVEGIDFIGQATATAAVLVTGEQFHWKDCRFENANNAGIGLHFKSKGLAAYEAGTAYSASIGESLGGNEYCWVATGVKFEAYSGLSVTQCKVCNDTFRNCSAACIAVGSTTDEVKNVMVYGNVFENNEDGSAPTDYIVLNGTNDTGFVADNVFACASPAATTITLASGVLFVANKTVAGISTQAPQ